jgi:hypothetical protein
LTALKTPAQSPGSTWLLGLTTGSLLIGMAVARSLTQSLIEIGQASEEIFRGDRLPILNLPQQDDPT